MGRLIDEDILIDAIPDDLNVFEEEDFRTSDMIHLIEDTPTVEAIPKVNVYKAIQEMMKYEHEGFINISLARLDEILKKCGVSENGNDD